ncbi:hypothetical protein COV05_01325 [Candidatus Uhrbacteria bacterium CG10_big_fil_rev_8_21_14_0_10_48_16]|uniref:Uncharacterized protein n=1 Tax=Candidatus Uhrbacteria bacterium CG10_big_fil_rev_8_21_14_0_10_48_16 TaxID=1975038 RepID=A0A2M8LHY1_9BACT|nr:MAG: hypothetical protein COV05_01325 [Candidatus Uhrbacteria bacterium CG10_big_fil_rev_8_21_14_0_10_48_16]
MNRTDIENLFGFAAEQKENGDLDGANRTFLQTVRDGVPQGVTVVLKADDDTKPANLVAWRQTRPYHFALLVLELEGEVSQIIPVPVLEEIGGPELVDTLIKIARYEQFDYNEDDDCDDLDGDDCDEIDLSNIEAPWNETDFD